jgi:hypothetical protein
MDDLFPTCSRDSGLLCRAYVLSLSIVADLTGIWYPTVSESDVVNDFDRIQDPNRVGIM